MAVAATRPMVRVSKAIAEAFRTEGVRDLFGLMGDGNMEFLAHFMDLEGCRYVALRHENMAVAAAEAYARIAGDVGAASVTMGPGLTHTATALVTASRGNIPIVVLTGNPGKGAQAMDQKSFVESCECVYLQYGVLRDVAEAFYLARTRRKPVVLSVPLGLQERDAPPVAYLPRPIPAQPRLAPNAEAIARAAEWIAGAKQPVILAGRGAVGATAELDELAALLGAPLGSTLPVKGELGSGPHAVGTVGGYASDDVVERFSAADVVIAVGASLSRMTTRTQRLFPSKAVIHIDTAPGAREPVGLPIVADAALGVRALVDELRRRGFAQRPRTAMPAADQLTIDLATHTWTMEPGRLDPRLVSGALDRVVPADALVITDVGHFHEFICRYMGPGSGRHFEIQSEFGAIGQGVGMAIGASVARPERTVLFVAGDGGFMQDLQDLHTIALYCPNVITVIMNDGALGAEYHKLGAKGLDRDKSNYVNPNLVAIAEAMGMRARQGDSIGTIERTVREFLAGRGPWLLDVPISRTVVSRHYREDVLPALA